MAKNRAYSIALWMLAIPVAHFILLTFWFLPAYFIQPQYIRSPIYYVSHKLASVFVDFSEMTLALGATCNTTRTVCLESFILEGDLSPEDGEKFEQAIEKLLASRPDIRLVCLNSKGGYTEAAAKIARKIKSLDLDTCVGDMPIARSQLDLSGLRYTATCESACSMILLAGKRRIAIGDNFLIGLHSPKTLVESPSKNVSKSAQPTQNDRQKYPFVNYMSDAARVNMNTQYTGALQVTNEVLEGLYTESSRTPNSRMYFASVPEQMKLNLFTTRVGSSFN
jgi:hypothetical protein